MIFWVGISAIVAAFALVITLVANGPPLPSVNPHDAFISPAPASVNPQATPAETTTANMAFHPNDIIQHSTVSALMAGFARAGPSAGQLSRYGTHGIGTFAAMDGEMVLVAGRAYQFTSDGAVRTAPNNLPLPFVQVTRFAPEYNLTVPRRWAKRELLDLFAYGGPDAGGRNSFIAVAVAGRFKRVDVRVAGPQESPEQPLSEVAANAKQWSIDDVDGTMFGFVSPKWAQGISVAGPHLHFVSDAQSGGKLQGGHVRDFEAEPGATLQWAVSGHHHLGLPRGKEWEALEMATVDTAGIQEAEE